MTSSELGALRLARAFGFALAAFALSVGAHVLAGGPTPSVTASLVLGGSIAWASLFLTHRRRGAWSITAAMALTQVLLHRALTLSATGGGCWGLHSGHGHLHTVRAATHVVCAAMPSLSQAHGIPVGMTLAHAVAAVVLGLILARGESAIWFLASLVWPSPPMPATPLSRMPRAWPVATAQPLRRMRSGLEPISRRGPPRALTAALG